MNVVRLIESARWLRARGLSVSAQWEALAIAWPGFWPDEAAFRRDIDAANERADLAHKSGTVALRPVAADEMVEGRLYLIVPKLGAIEWGELCRGKKTLPPSAVCYLICRR